MVLPRAELDEVISIWIKMKTMNLIKERVYAWWLETFPFFPPLILQTGDGFYLLLWVMSRTNIDGSGISTNFPLSNSLWTHVRQSSLSSRPAPLSMQLTDSYFYHFSLAPDCHLKFIHRLLPFQCPHHLPLMFCLSFNRLHYRYSPLLLSSPYSWLAMRQSNRSLLR